MVCFSVYVHTVASVATGIRFQINKKVELSWLHNIMFITRLNTNCHSNEAACLHTKYINFNSLRSNK